MLTKTDLTKQKGDKITFSTLQRLLGKGVSGTTALEGAEENLVPGVYTVTVELFRHATSANDIARQESLLDFPRDAGRKMSEWHARFRDDNFMSQILNVDTIQALFAGGKTSRGNLGPADTFNTRELKRLHLAGRRRGVRPFRTTRKAQLPWPAFGALISEVDYYNLIESDDFKQDMRLGAERGNNNPALDGSVDMYQGIVLWIFGSVNPGDGMLGSFLRPEARLAATITVAGTSVTAGPTTAITNVDYWQYFPGAYAYGETISGTHTVLIDAEQMTFTTAPTDTTLTVVRAAGGTVGVAHTAGALMTLNNVGKVVLFGVHAALEAWAMPVQRIRQERDYGMELGIGVKWMYEVKGVANADATLANAVAMETTSPNPNTV